MRSVFLAAASLALAACATSPNGGLTNAQLRDANLDSGLRPTIDAAAPAMEAAVRAQLKDPESAQFEWRNDFRRGRYKPIGRAEVYGWFTCGSVNAKNGLGGYTGPEAVVVVMSNGSVTLVDIDNGPYHPIANDCAKNGMPIL